VTSGAKPEKTWQVAHTPQVRAWLRSLNEKDHTRIEVAIQQLSLDGPTLDPARSKLITSSRHRNMKELRSVGGYLRVLFAFAPRQRAVLLVGGDTSGNWDRWYKRHVPLADRFYGNHLRSFGKEGGWTATARTPRER
jgi:hypothetical protein